MQAARRRHVAHAAVVVVEVALELEHVAQVLGAREVLVEEQLDRNLLGGFVAEVGSYVVDGSLNGQLARIEERLANV